MRRRLGLLPAMALLVAVLPALSHPPVARAQVRPTVGATPDAPLRIESVSPWVEPDGEFQVRFAPTTAVPADARLTVTVHQSLGLDGPDGLRDEVLELVGGASPRRILQVPFTVDVATLGDPSTGAVLTVPIRSTRRASDRVLLPNPGIHPVRLELTDAAGEELWEAVVFLNRLPVREPGAPLQPSPVQVRLLMPVDAPPAVAADGAASFSVEDRTVLGAAGSLLSAVPEAPLLVGATPNVLDGLERAGQPWSDQLLGALSDRSAAHVLALSPYVELDLPGLLAAGGNQLVARQLLVGAATTTARTGREPIGTTWVPPDRLDPAALSAVADAGFSTVLVAADDLDADGDDGVLATPFRFAAEPRLSGLAIDEELSRLVADRGADAPVRAHQVVSLLMAGWFSALGDAEADRAAAVLVTPTTEPAVLRLLSAALTGDGPLRSDPAAPLVAPEDRLVELVDGPAADLATTVRAAERTAAQLLSYRSMAGDADPRLELWEVLHDQSVAADLDPGARASFDRAVTSGIAARLRAIELPRPRRVVLTSDDTTIPLRFRNDLPFDVTVRVDARSSRLDLGDAASSEILLVPGENRIDLPVEVQAPGETLLRLEVRAPDGGLVVGSVAVPVRSTAISGVGAALSVLSVTFLVGWWILTHRRNRRRAARSTGRHPVSGPAPDDPGTPVGASTGEGVQRRG